MTVHFQAREGGRSWWWILLAMVALVMASAACSVGDLLVGQVTPTHPAATRTLRPTFTPLPGGLPTATTAAQPPVRGVLPPGVVIASTNAPQGRPTADTEIVLYATATSPPRPTIQSTPAPTVPSPTSSPTFTSSPTPFAVANSAGVSGRRGPGTQYELVGNAEQGQQMIVLGRNSAGDWLVVCCVANQPVWVPANLLTINGAVNSLPVATPRPTALPTNTPPPPPPSSTPTQTPTPTLPFDIGDGPQFLIKRETGILTIWVKVWEGPTNNQKPLAGYILKVFRNEVDVSQPTQSHARSEFDSAVPEAPYVKYNLKFEMDRAGEAAWRIYLARPDGTRVSPVTNFTTLGDAYRNQVVYIGYFLAR